MRSEQPSTYLIQYVRVQSSYRRRSGSVAGTPYWTLQSALGRAISGFSVSGSVTGSALPPSPGSGACMHFTRADVPVREVRTAICCGRSSPVPCDTRMFQVAASLHCAGTKCQILYLLRYEVLLSVRCRRHMYLYLYYHLLVSPPLAVFKHSWVRASGILCLAL